MDVQKRMQNVIWNTQGTLLAYLKIKQLVKWSNPTQQGVTNSMLCIPQQVCTWKWWLRPAIEDW